MDDGSAAVAFDPGELGVKAGAEDAEYLGSLTDAGVLGDDQQAVQALAAWEPWRSGSGISLGWCPAVVSGLAYSCWAPSPEFCAEQGYPSRRASSYLRAVKSNRASAIRPRISPRPHRLVLDYAPHALELGRSLDPRQAASVAESAGWTPADVGSVAIKNKFRS